MISRRDLVIFFAGAEVFHTLSHLIIGVSGTLPIKFFFVTWNQSLNIWAILINGIITVLLLWYARSLK